MIVSKNILVNSNKLLTVNYHKNGWKDSPFGYGAKEHKNVPKNIVISSEQYIGRAVLAVQMHCLLESKL